MLTVVVREAKDLSRQYHQETPDSYVKVVYAGQRAKTRTVRHTFNPHWEQPLAFNFEGPSEIEFRVYDRSFPVSELIGFATIPCHPSFEDWLPLTDKHGQPTGWLLVAIHAGHHHGYGAPGYSGYGAGYGGAGYSGYSGYGAGHSGYGGYGGYGGTGYGKSGYSGYNGYSGYGGYGGYGYGGYGARGYGPNPPQYNEDSWYPLGYGRYGATGPISLGTYTAPTYTRYGSGAVGYPSRYDYAGPYAKSGYPTAGDYYGQAAGRYGYGGYGGYGYSGYNDAYRAQLSGHQTTAAAAYSAPTYVTSYGGAYTTY
eukprot:EG_transcript_12705